MNRMLQEQSAEKLSLYLGDERLMKMKEYVQHGDVSTYDHAVLVAFYSCMLACRLGLKYDERALIRGALLDADNRELASANSEFVFPAKPAWLHTALWDDRSVPAPFTPIERSGASADVLRRHYEFGGNGLPAAIESAGAPLLAAPARIALKVNGKNEILMFDELEVLEQADDLVSWRFNGRSDSVQLNGVVTLEFDGFVRWQAE